MIALGFGQVAVWNIFPSGAMRKKTAARGIKKPLAAVLYNRL
jgi:hypothetical protein